MRGTGKRADALTRDHRQTMVRRLKYFAAYWLGTSAVWTAVVVQGRPGVLLPAALALGAQAGILFATSVLCRAAPTSVWVPRALITACILLGISVVGLFAALGGNGGVLAFVLLTLYLASSLCFAWGWLPALAVMAGTVIPWLLAIPQLHFLVPADHLAAAIAIGSGLTLTIAEGTARGFRIAFTHRLREEENRRALEASLADYRDLTEHSPDLIATIDVGGRFTYVNAALAAQLGAPPSGLVGCPVREFLPDDPANASILALLDDPTAAREPLPPQVFRLRTVRGLRWLEAVFSLVRGPGGRVTGLRGISRDITERRRLEAERDAVLAREQSARREAERARAQAEEARREAEAATAAKDDFLAVLSHELRSPLNAVLSWTHMLRAGVLDEPKRLRALETIERSARAQVRLIEDLLDVSRIVSGKLTLEMATVDLGTVITAVLEQLRGSAELRGLTLEVRLDEEEAVVRGDPTRLQQIVDNLLSNAMKFTSEGGRVAITLANRGREAEITVSDTGIGIRRDLLPRVFERFRQGDRSTTRRYGGLGLGLAITHHLVALHGGSITAESAGEQRGATFTVRLPLDPGAARRAGRRDGGVPGAAPFPSLDRVRLLIVDDEESTRDFLATVFGSCGAEVTAVGSAWEALAWLERGRPDVLVSDLAMPDEDGYSLIRAIRARERTGTRIPAIALTALASADDRRRVLDAGFDLHMAKPVMPAELVAAVARAAGVGAADCERGSAGSTTPATT